MANPEVKTKRSKEPSRAASLQRMLEIERKQKMERLQQNSPAPPSGRRGVSPASFSSANSKPSLLSRRRDSSLPRDDQRTSHPRSYALPPLSIYTESPPPPSLPKEKTAKSSPKQAHTRSTSEGPKVAPVTEPKKLDRDTLPSMTKASNITSPNMRTVTFLPSDDGHDSDNSSICHSPTWDDYSKKRRKDKEVDQRRKRLTKREPPPAAMDNNRPELNPRAMSDPVLNNNNNNANPPRPSLETFKARSVQPLVDAQTEVPSVPQPLQTSSVETVETVVRSPAFIGGVRLEREREAALKRLMNSRAPSSERPASEVIQSKQTTKTDALKKRETAPPTPHYPPTASKTSYLAHSQQPSKGHNRKRTGSFGTGLINSAAKIFQPREKDPQLDDLTLQRNRSRESVSSIQSLFASALERGRQMGGSAATSVRTQSSEGHARNTTSPNKEGRRGGIRLPPLSWKNQRRERTASMMAVPPDSARDATFPSEENSPKLKQDNFSFLEQPFSPGLSAPLSPPASVSASLKAKMSPQSSPSSRPLSQPPKKNLKQTLRAGLRSSILPERPQNQRSVTESFVGNDVPLPRDSHPLQSNPLSASSANNIKGVPYDQLPSPVSQPRSGPDAKYSGASSSSSHPDTESQPSSPLTSPDTSRPQSAKDNQIFRLEDLKKAMQNQTNGQAPSRPVASVLPGQGSGLAAPKVESPRTKVDPKPKSTPNETKKQAVKVRESNFVEDFRASQAFLAEDSWSQTKKPLDADQLSFTSALTSLDVKRSFQDLNQALDSPNADVEPLSLDKYQKNPAKDTKAAKKHVRLDLKQGPVELRPHTHGAQASSSATGYQAYRPSTNAPAGRLPDFDVDSTSSSRTRADSPDPYPSPPSKASAYLQEARRAAPASPRGPASSSSKSIAASSSHTSSPLGSPHSTSSRSFGLAAPPANKSLLSTSTSIASSSSVGVPAQATVAVAAAAVMVNPSPLAAATLSSTDESKILGKPIAKMLVECCHCRFYQDMPSRVYEAMARPDDVVKDKLLGVSGQVTTCVKCPWCSHNMSTACCAGYAAVVYLKEKLHGR